MHRSFAITRRKTVLGSNSEDHVVQHFQTMTNETDRRLRLWACGAQVVLPPGFFYFYFVFRGEPIPRGVVYVCVRSFMYTLVILSRLKLQLYRATPHHTH